MTIYGLILVDGTKLYFKTEWDRNGYLNVLSLHNYRDYKLATEFEINLH